jgi:DNA-directed RNA polymerase specialized sigma subunit
MVEAITRELSEKFQRTPTEAEVAEKLGIGIDRWRRMVLELRTLGLMLASSYAPYGEQSNTPEFSGCTGESQPDDICAHEHLRQVLGRSHEDPSRAVSESSYAASSLQGTDNEGDRLYFSAFTKAASPDS